MLTISDKEGPLGTISLEDGELVASVPTLEAMARNAVRMQGSAEAGYAYLRDRPSNGYVWAQESGGDLISAQVLREADLS